MDPVRIDELDTPFLTVDLDVFEYNVRLCISSFDGVRVRPHLKPWWTRGKAPR
jgi:D-serine deaminase-like pyridoxal phosphate-dependent protein